MADRNRVGALVRRWVDAVRSVQWGSRGYVIPAIEYQSDTDLPPNGKLRGPAARARLLERSRDRIDSRPCLCGKPACPNVGCPADERTYRAALYCGCWPSSDEGTPGMPGYEALHPYDPSRRECVCLYSPEDTHA